MISCSSRSPVYTFMSIYGHSLNLITVNFTVNSVHMKRLPERQEPNHFLQKWALPRFTCLAISQLVFIVIGSCSLPKKGTRERKGLSRSCRAQEWELIREK
jgi:hypothetical protein